MYKKIIAILVIISVSLLLLYVYYEGDEESKNIIPLVEITYPSDGATISKIVTISGTASDPDGDDNLLEVEVMINNEWYLANGNKKWSYEWRTYDIEDGPYIIRVRSWDRDDYSEIEEISIRVDNPDTVETDSHKWAIFIAAANFPKDNESKLGNGALNLAERMSAYFIEDLGYSTNNIIILFDDGWIRDDNGYGEPIETLQQRRHQYDITYAATTKETVISSITYIVEESNKFDDSEIFIWISSHGCGDQD